MENIKQNKGQGLIEVIIAISIIIIGIGGILALTTRSFSSTEKSVKEVVATNLAREGVEMTRDVRDSFWLAGEELSEALHGAGGAIGTMNFVPMLNEWTYDLFSLVNKDPKTATDTILYLHKDSGIYTHQNISGSENSGFRRFVTLHAICFYNGSEHILNYGDLCRSVGPLVKEMRGVKVVSTVYWMEKGKLKQTKQEEDLYDWYFANPY